MNLNVLFSVLSLLGVHWAQGSNLKVSAQDKDLECLNQTVCATLEDTIVTKRCKCEKLCFGEPLCMAFALNRTQANVNEWHCMTYREPDKLVYDYATYKYKIIDSPGTVLSRRAITWANVVLEEDGFFYTLLEGQTSTGIMYMTGKEANDKMRKRCAALNTETPRLHLALITTNRSLSVAKKYSTYVQTPLLISLWRRNQKIAIGSGAFTLPLTETELCNGQPTCDIFGTAIMNQNEEYEVFALQNGKIVTAGVGPKYNVMYNDTTFALLCQGNYFGLKL